MTVADVLKLPSMIGAEVIAGRGGLERPVDSVNVLEYAYTDTTLGSFFDANRFDGNDMLITCFAAISGDVDAQCENIRRYNGVGAAGLILYYVGVVMPEVDKRLMELCDELDFVLICMPVGQTNLRYSEAIREILFKIYREQEREHFFVTALLSRFSSLPAQQRSMETLLRMLSEYLRVSIVLAEQRRSLNTASFWPRTLGDVLREKLPRWFGELGAGGQMEIALAGGSAYLQSCPQLFDDADNMRLYTISFGTPLSPNILWQCSECVRLFINIWNKDRGKFVISELVRAIINDEPVRKTQLAQLFHVRVEELRRMWLFIPRESRAENDDRLLRECTEHFSAGSNPLLVSYYEDTLVAFTTGSVPATLEPGAHGSERLREITEKYEVICCDNLSDSTEAHQAYMNSMAHWKTARKLYPGRSVLTLQEISFARICDEVSGSRENLEQYLQLAACLKRANPELMRTLTAYFLDCSANMAETARRLFVHLNTVKYRLRQVQEVCGYSPTAMPGSYLLYLTAAIDRLAC